MVDPILFVLRFIFDFWWLLFPALLVQICWEKFKINQRIEYATKNIRWAFVELKFPSNITRTPRAMEEVFNALHALAPDPEKDLSWYNLNIKGFIPKSYTLLIIAHNQRLRFYLRFPKELKEFIKTRFYSQYPEIQFEEKEDPLNILPPQIPNSLFDIEIFDARLQKEDAYPIKTYTIIENLPREQQLDPISTFSEAAMQISNKEWIIFQIIILPTASNWVERGKKVVNKLIGREEKKEPSVWEEVQEFIVNLLLAPFRQPQWKTLEKKEEKEFNIQKLTPGERRVVELIQTKLGKLGYLCNLRIVYLATKDVFSVKKDEAISLISSTLKNFSTEDLNGFTLNSLIKNNAKENLLVFILKNLEYGSFQKHKTVTLPTSLTKKFKPKNLEAGFVLNSEELASLFHPPMEFVPPLGIERIPIREFPPPRLE